MHPHADAVDARVAHLHRHCHDRPAIVVWQQASFHSSWSRSVLLQGMSSQPYGRPPRSTTLTSTHRQTQVLSHQIPTISSTTCPRTSTSTTTSSKPSKAAPKLVNSRTSTKSDSGRTAPATRTTRQAPRRSPSAQSPRRTSGLIRSACGSSRIPACRRLAAMTCKRA